MEGLAQALPHTLGHSGCPSVIPSGQVAHQSSRGIFRVKKNQAYPIRGWLHKGKRSCLLGQCTLWFLFQVLIPERKEKGSMFCTVCWRRISENHREGNIESIIRLP